MFHRCNSKDEVKKLYRRLAHKLHPDYGGDHELMVLLNEAQLIFIKAFEDEENAFKPFEKAKPKPKPEEDKTLKYKKTYDDIYEGDEKLEILHEITNYVEGKKSFDRDFLDSVIEFFNENGYVSSGQYNALVNVYYSFQMHRTQKQKT